MAVAPKIAMADTQPATPAPPSSDAAVIWANFGPASKFPDGAWKLSQYPPEFGHRKAFVQVTGGTAAIALSPKCPHQFCPVDFDATAKQFVCPCHGAKFSDTGALVSGPATTGLTTLQAKIDSGNVMVQSLTPPPKPAS